MEVSPPRGQPNTDQVIARLHLRGAACAYISGSVVEGLGNAESDVDVYVLCRHRPARTTTKWGSAAVDSHIVDGIRVDVEYWPLACARRLIDRINRFVLVPEAFPDMLELEEVEFVHRLLVGVPIWREAAFQAVRGTVRQDRFRALLVTKYLKMCDGMFQDAMGSLGAGDPVTAAYNARLAMERAADAYLASRGRTNPAIKWRYRKLCDVRGPGDPLVERFVALEFGGVRAGGGGAGGGGAGADGGGLAGHVEQCLELANRLSDLAQDEGGEAGGGTR